MSRWDWDIPRLVEYPQRRTGCQYRVMLCLLSFAYATGRFSSQAIADAAGSDAVLHAICEGQAPFAQELRAFRRQYRSVLERVLASVFVQVVTHRLNLHPNTLSSDTERDLRDRAAERLEIAWQMDMDDD
jgi:hypothetical protein